MLNAAINRMQGSMPASECGRQAAALTLAIIDCVRRRAFAHDAADAIAASS